MPNAGYPAVRKKVAEYMKAQSGVDFAGDNILMIAGAAAGLNVVRAALLVELEASRK